MKIISISMLIAVVLLSAAECKVDPKTGDSNPRPSTCDFKELGCGFRTERN